MKIRRLQIEQHMARLQIETQIARLSIRSPIRRIKTVDRQNAQMIVERERPSIEIKNERMGVNTMTRQNAPIPANQVRQDKTINGQPAGSLPGNNGVGSPPVRIRIPVVRVPGNGGNVVSHGERRIAGNPGSLQIDWSIQDIAISWDEYQAPIITVDPKPSVDIRLAQEASVEIKIVEQTYPPETGEFIDEEA